MHQSPLEAQNALTLLRRTAISPYESVDTDLGPQIRVCGR